MGLVERRTPSPHASSSASSMDDGEAEIDAADGTVASNPYLLRSRCDGGDGSLVRTASTPPLGSVPADPSQDAVRTGIHSRLRSANLTGSSAAH